MNCAKVGALIASLRREKGLTQKQLADALHISDKTVSKWERGLGCPDVSLLRALAAALGVELSRLLEGALGESRADSGNLARVRFYVCPSCGSLSVVSGTPELSCCGRRLLPLTAKPADAAHAPQIAEIEDEFYVTFPHEMSKGHYLAFAAWVTGQRVELVRLYPEGEAAFRLPRQRMGRLYFYCTRDGLFVSE